MCCRPSFEFFSRSNQTAIAVAASRSFLKRRCWPFDNRSEISCSLRESFQHGLRPNWQNPAIILATIIIIGFVARSSDRTYKFWLPDNLKSLAIARAVTAAEPTLGQDTPLVFDQPEYAPFVEARLGRPIHALLDYTDIFKNPIASTPDFRPTSLSDLLFEYWKQMDVTPDAAKQILDHEALLRGGYYTGFLFNVCEYWYPCTDGRDVKTEKIVAAIPSVVTAYANFLSKYEPPRKFAFVISKSLSERPEGTMISEGHAAIATAHIFLRN